MQTQNYNTTQKNIIQLLTSGNYQFDPVKNMNLHNYMENVKGINLIYGVDCYSGIIHDKYKNVLIDLEQPNFIPHRMKVEKYLAMSKKLDKILTLCPFTAKYMNKITNRQNSEQCFFPVDIQTIIHNIGHPNNDKPINVLYIGHNVSHITAQLIALSEKISMPTYMDKMAALYKSKIAICTNVLYYHNSKYDYNQIITQIPELRDDEKLEIPQLKSRIFEAGFSKCIPLVYFHKSKIVETYFTPDVDFIYFHTLDELKRLINKIVNDYGSYKYISENIYKKCMENYKCSDFIEKYIKPMQNEFAAAATI